MEPNVQLLRLFVFQGHTFQLEEISPQSLSFYPVLQSVKRVIDSLLDALWIYKHV